jgi:hypothetical protein
MAVRRRLRSVRRSLDISDSLKRRPKPKPAQTAGPLKMKTSQVGTPKPAKGKVAKTSTPATTPAPTPKTNLLHRNVRRLAVGDKTYAFSRKSGDTRTVTKTADTRTAVFKDKDSGATVTRTTTKGADGKKTTVNTVSDTKPPEAKKKKKGKKSTPSTGSGSGSNNSGSSGNPGY